MNIKITIENNHGSLDYNINPQKLSNRELSQLFLKLIGTAKAVDNAGKTLVQREDWIWITDYPSDKKIAGIKAIREFTDLGLREAKELIERTPVPVIPESHHRANDFITVLNELEIDWTEKPKG